MPDEGSDEAQTHYHLDLSLNYEQHTMTIIEIIDYTNWSELALDALPLVIPPNHQPGIFNLISLQSSGETSISQHEADNNLLLQLDPPLDPHQTLQLQLIYKLTLPQANSSLGFNDRQTLLVDWYPFIPPQGRDGQWIIHAPGAVGEYLSYPLSDFDVTLRISPAAQALVVAASATPTAVESNCYRYQTAARRGFSLAISPFYQRFTQTFQDVTIEVFTLPEHAALAERAAALAGEAWSVYQQLFGDNHRDYLSIVEAEMHDGLETDGMFLLSDWYFASADETLQNYFSLLVVHETAHQWFFGSIHNDQALEPWLDESLATYAELLFLENDHPDLVTWWWDFRVDTYAPSGYINTSIYDFSEERPYINAVYLQGAKCLQTIRDKIGDEAFFDVLMAYSQMKEHDIRTAEDFFSILDTYAEGMKETLKGLYFK
jgi:hypothetical protein